MLRDDLVTVANHMDLGACRCRSCQVLYAALAIVDQTRTDPGAIAGRDTESSPELEAVGLVNAALVAIIAAQGTPAPDGRPAVAMQALMTMLARVLDRSFAAFGLQVTTTGSAFSETAEAEQVH